MKNILVKKQPIKPAVLVKQQKILLKPSYYILLMAYIFVILIIPGFHSLDSNAPKFLGIALLNLISLLVLYFDSNNSKLSELQFGFFKSYIGIAYTLFLIISLLSIINAINLSESVLNIVKIFSVFSSTYILYVIFSSNREYLFHVTIAISLLLLVDCFTVFYGALEYINGNLTSIGELKSVYSNKNIFASALFVKIPFAIWLLYFSYGWRKYLGYLAVFLSILATLFLSTRAFYLGLGLIIIMFALVAIFNYITKKDKKNISLIFRFIGLFAIALFIFYLTQHYLYPKKNDRYNTGITARISTINAEEFSVKLRLLTWQRSLKIIEEYPLLGVGSGNWKIVILKYESKASRTYQMMIKNHNDFIEISAEIGLFGGLAYLSIFILIIYSFIYTFIKSKADENKLKLLFLPAFGILAYSIDAFFNFPADRPEIQIFFAIYVASAIAFYNMLTLKKEYTFSTTFFQKINNLLKGKWMRYLILLLFISATYIHILNVKSSVLQRYHEEDGIPGAQKRSATYMMKEFPTIPSISSKGVPIIINIITYLINEGRNREAIDLLLVDNTSPYDSRREFFLSLAYAQMGKLDSAVLWGRIAHELKPLEYQTNENLSKMVFDAGFHDEAMKITAEYAEKLEDSPEAWKLAASTYLKCGKLNQAVFFLKQAEKLSPNDSSITKQLNSINLSLKFSPYDSLYNNAINMENKMQYKKAVELFTMFINKKPSIAEAYQQRAYCFYNLHSYKESLIDINKAIKYGIELTPAFINLRGVVIFNLGKKEAACEDFKFAMDKGDADGYNNFQKFCNQK